jgi:hypothetical protein
MISLADLAVLLGATELLLTMLLHAVGNAFATLEIVVLEHWLK